MLRVPLGCLRCVQLPSHTCNVGAPFATFAPQLAPLPPLPPLPPFPPVSCHERAMTVWDGTEREGNCIQSPPPPSCDGVTCHAYVEGILTNTPNWADADWCADVWNATHACECRRCRRGCDSAVADKQGGASAAEEAGVSIAHLQRRYAVRNVCAAVCAADPAADPADRTVLSRIL